MKLCLVVPVLLGLSIQALCQSKPPADLSQWTIYITNDACSDYTWGFDEAQTRKAYADVVRAHLDEMIKTDKEAPENRDRYNMSITQEADAFLEYYPERKDELVRRIHEGQIAVGAVYDNALWGFQSTEGMIRAFYPAMRLEKNWGIPMDVVEHMEQPGLPWGAATIAAASGFRWISMPYYDFDSTFSELTNPPLFVWTGPDGSVIGVRMDKFASDKAHYTEGAYLLKTPSLIAAEWVPHYRSLSDYPAGPLLASGTHGDNNPTNWKRAAGFAEGVISYNNEHGPHPKLVNSTLPMFFHSVEATNYKLPALRGDFGDSWDVWPVTLSTYASKARIEEHRYLTAESLLALSPESAPATEQERRRAEWNWIMLADHAWNGTDDHNRSVNAELRHKWSDDLSSLASDLTDKGWMDLGVVPDATHITIYNPLSFARPGLVKIVAPAGAQGVAHSGRPLDAQFVEEDGNRYLYFVAPPVPAFGFTNIDVASKAAAEERKEIKATNSQLENQWYRLTIDEETGGIKSLIDKASGAELAMSKSGTTLGQTTYFDGAEHHPANVTSVLDSIGAVFARLKIDSSVDDIRVTTFITLYKALDVIDLDYRIHKPLSKTKQRLTQTFPLESTDSEERLETVGAVIRPLPQPAGDLLPGADTHRFVVQGFVDVSRKAAPGFTIAPVEPFFLRKDLEDITFEVLGNDQDFEEMTHDQNGVTDFRYRYTLRRHGAGYDNAGTVAWSREVANPVVAVSGRLAKPPSRQVSIDARRAIATALKPGEEGGSLLRIWETAGQSGAVDVSVKGFHRAILTDLLERPLGALPIRRGVASVKLKANGFAAIQLLP